MPPLVVTPVRRTQLLALAGTVVGFAVGVWMAVTGSPGRATVGLLILVVCGAAIVTWVRELRSPRPAVVADDDGLTVRTAPWGAVAHLPWREVTALDLRHGPMFVVVQVTDPAAVLARVGRFRRVVMRLDALLTGSPVTIPTIALPVSADELARAVAARAPAGVERR